MPGKTDEFKFFNVDEEIKKFSELEIEVNETIEVLDKIISYFTPKNEVLRGSANKLVLLMEQKISLYTRKESIIKNLADMKKNVFNANTKIINGEDSDTDFAKVLMEYTEEVKKKRKVLEESKESALALIEEISNQDEVENYFN